MLPGLEPPVKAAPSSCIFHSPRPQLPRGPPWDLPFAGCDPAGRPRVYLAASFFATCAGAGGENLLGSRLQTKVQLTLTKTLQQLRSWESWERVFKQFLEAQLFRAVEAIQNLSSRLSELPKDSAFEHSSRLLAKNSSHPWTPTHWDSGVWRSGRDSINPGWFESSQLARIVDYLMSFTIKSSNAARSQSFSQVMRAKSSRKRHGFIKQVMIG